MKCSVVILNWNGEKTLKKFLPSVIRQTQLPDTEIVVADNGSTDGSVDYLKTQPVRLIQLDKNYGFAEGYNRAIQQIDAEYVVLLNSDIEPTDRWLDIMLEYMDQHQEVVAAQPKVLSWHSKQRFAAGETDAIRFEHAGAAGGMLDALGYPYCRGRLMTYIEDDHGQYDDTIPIFWATGACMLVRMQVYEELGGLDGAFFAHQEEIDFCWRIHNAYPSSTIVCIPQATVYHVGGGTLGYENPRKTFLNFRNNLLMIYKNMPTTRLWWVMSIRFAMDYLAAIQMLLTHQVPNMKAVFQARRAFHRMKHTYPRNNQVSTIGTRLLTKRSIVFDFYLLKKKQ